MSLHARPGVALLVPIVLTVFAGCGSTGVQNQGAVGNLPAPSTPESTLFPGVTVDPSRPTVHTWQYGGIVQALDAWQRAVHGSLRMTEVVLYADYAIMRAREPEHSANVDSYLFRASRVDAPSPVMGSPNENLDAKTFTRPQVAWRAVPGLVLDAPRRAAIENGHVTHVIVARDPVFSGGALLVHVYVGNERTSSYVEYDAAGQYRRTVR
ncbi:MAG: hypothetical protein JWL83_4718 [Actinomycetia bacterium]|nr:hypothetical protein [Actinomycetes bacterium]